MHLFSETAFPSPAKPCPVGSIPLCRHPEGEFIPSFRSLPPLKRQPLVDSYGRTVRYLRLSMTDRCNLNCDYCLPQPMEGGHPREFLTIGEWERVIRAFAEMGITKVRLTGGEPTIHPQLIDLIRLLKSFSQITDIALSTNGVLMERLSRPLKAAGLNRVNFSLDTLNPDTFETITGKRQLHLVLAGLEAAIEAGLHPIKLNAVLMKGVNEGEILDLVALAVARGVEMRFIEYMPSGRVLESQKRQFLSATEAEKVIRHHFSLEPLPRGATSGPSREFILNGGPARVGFITPMSCTFCQDCNRIRLTARGHLRTCLFDNQEGNLRPLLQSPTQREALSDRIRAAVLSKPESHQLLSGNFGTLLTLSQTGG